MANIDKELNQIKNAVYGREVRGSIHDGIDKINKETEIATGKADEAHDVMESIINDGFDNAALESNFEQKLDDKINNLQPEWTQFKEQTNQQLAETENQLENLIDNQPLFFNGNELLDEIIDQAILKRKTIKIPAGTYIIDSPIVKNLSTIDLDIIGEGSTEGHPKTRLLWRGGAGTMFTFTNTRYVNFRDIEISGSIPGDESRVVSGATGINSTGVITMDNVVLMGFERLMEWNGGYYHKFINCKFRYFTHGFYRFNGNNVIFDKCVFGDFEELMTVSHGDGQLVIDKCSIERWSGTAFAGVSGSWCLINITNSYIENYENVTPPPGINGDYKSSNLITGFGTVNLKDNVIVTNGIKRVVNSSTATRKITSVGNRIRFKNVDSNLEYYIYKNINVETIYCDDFAQDGLSQDGFYTPQYIHSIAGLDYDSSYVYDAFNKKVMTIEAHWRNIPLSNGWTASSIPNSQYPQYRKRGKQIELRGVIDGTGATSSNIATLPSGFYDDKEQYIVCADNTNQETALLKLSSNGILVCGKSPRPENLVFNAIISLE